MTPEMQTLRGDLYHRDLQYLTDEQWTHAVSVCRQGEWFPSIEKLHSVGMEIRPAGEHKQIPAWTGRSSDQMAINLRGLAMIREELAKRGIIVQPGPLAKAMPREPGQEG